VSDLDSERFEAVIKEFLEERFEISPALVTADAPLHDLGLDSMMMLEVMLELEDRLGLKLTDLSMPANPTVNDVIALVVRNEAHRAA